MPTLENPNRKRAEIVSPSVKLLVRALLVAMAMAAAAFPARAGSEAIILVDVETGKVMQAENATYPWYPASTSKLMTTYVILHAIKEGRIGFDSVFTFSPIAAAQSPSKMGFRTGTQVTVDNALKMLLVHSANDIAVVLAEGLDGSIEKFADEMNATSQRLGMTQSSWVNPNGLPAEGQISSARDLAILSRALIREFPEWDFYWHIPSIKLGKRVMTNYNKLLAEYPGADGMKTGFICSSGFNLVATATRNNRRLIAIVLGAPSSAVRAAKAASLLERGFNGSMLSWLLPSLGTVDALQPINAAPPDLHEQICGPHRKRPAAEDEDDDAAGTAGNDPQRAFMLSDLKGATRGSLLTGNPLAAVPPIVVYVGPKRATATATAEDDAAIPAAKKRKHAKKTDTKQADAKSAGAKSTDTKKPDAKKTDATTAKVTTAKPKAAPSAQ
jgi:D-alanyl-D-alanine carboxypeptidase